MLFVEILRANCFAQTERQKTQKPSGIRCVFRVYWREKLRCGINQKKKINLNARRITLDWRQFAKPGAA
jgi:hypothetical protein